MGGQAGGGAWRGGRGQALTVSLKGFHLLFIAVSVVLAAFVVAWAVQQYRTDREWLDLLAALIGLSSAGVLAVYGARFRQKVRRL